MKFIIDCDPGVDDVAALFLAFDSHIAGDIIGITCVTGNASVANGFSNAHLALKTVPFATDSLRVYPGATKRFDGTDFPPAEYHGQWGLGTFKAPVVPLKTSTSCCAIEFLIESSRRNCGDLTVIALGPLTNLALAQKRDASFSSRLAGLKFMGSDHMGWVEYTPTGAEFNFWVDAPAAHHVLSTFQCCMIGFGFQLCVDNGAKFAWSQFDSLLQAAGQSPTAVLMNRLVTMWRMTQTHARFCDALAMFSFIHPEHCEHSENFDFHVGVGVDSENFGCLVLNREKKQNEARGSLTFVTTIDHDKYQEVFRRMIMCERGVVN